MYRSTLCAFALLSFSLMSDFAHAESQLTWPLRCPDGSERGCIEHIFYPDIDADGRTADCSLIRARGHTGTDLIPYAAHANDDIEVLAAADGIILFTQSIMFDGCPDDHPECKAASRLKIRPGFVGGYTTCTRQGMFCDNGQRECFWCFSGNFVVMKHKDDENLYSAYLHLKTDSVTVRPLQHVNAGDVLGLVGSSGESLGPHLHFELWRDKLFNAIDPWAGPCGSADGLLEEPD